MEAVNYASDSKGLYIDTLHPVNEDTCRDQGARTTISFLNSKTGRSAVPSRDDVPGSSRRNGIRFPRHAVKTLRTWLDAHQNHPYPTEQEKADLEKQTELQPSQIASWLANARRRRKTIGKISPAPGMSPRPRPSTPNIDIPERQRPWDDLNPLERWQHSPPENEPATLTDIVNAVANSDLPDEAASPSSYETRHRKESSNGSGPSGRRAPSTTSAETSHPSSLSASSAAVSHGSSHGSFGSFSSSLGGKQDRRRRKRAGPLRRPAEDKRRSFQCTFCTDTFRSKYDWTRHEKSLHLSLEKWTCAPLGQFIADGASGKKVCVYCGLHDPPADHEDSHSHRACEEKGLDSRTFYRKDHLRQHLRLMHGCEMASNMEAWKFTTTEINSRCGFCGQRFTVWQERVDHLTAHFRSGARMIDWKGCRGLDPSVAHQVTNAMPPYLIGIESVSPNPFSATNTATMQHTFMVANNHEDASYTAAQQTASGGQLRSDACSSRTTCWEILTVRLGRYANEMIAQGTVLSDEMLQTQARRILYDSDDNWNQTAADHPEWLDLFKKAHGLDLIPSKIGGQGAKVPEDLEWYSDLGLRVPFFVQLQQYNDAHRQRSMRQISDGSPKVEQDSVRFGVELRHLYQQLANEGVLHDEHHRCLHEECEHNRVSVDFVHGTGEQAPSQRHWCDHAVPREKVVQLANLIHLTSSASSDAPPVAPNLTTLPPDADVQAARARASCLKNIQHGDVSCCPFREKNERLAKQRETEQALRARTRADPAPNANVEAARARASCLENLQTSEVDCCRWFREQSNALAEQNEAEQAPQPRASALGAPSLAQCQIVGSDWPVEKPTSQFSYLPRHKAALPPEKARRFATITPAWEESGKMPEAVSTAEFYGPTASPSVVTMTTTGAMMEFLGPTVGQHLPFSSHAATSSIALPTADATAGSSQLLAQDAPLSSDWRDIFASTAPEHDMLANDVGLAAAGSASVPVFDWSAATGGVSLDATMAEAGGTMDLSLGDVNFDELHFDDVFDMSLDDRFETS